MNKWQIGGLAVVSFSFGALLSLLNKPETIIEERIVERIVEKQVENIDYTKITDIINQRISDYNEMINSQKDTTENLNIIKEKTTMPDGTIIEKETHTLDKVVKEVIKQEIVEKIVEVEVVKEQEKEIVEKIIEREVEKEITKIEYINTTKHVVGVGFNFTPNQQFKFMSFNIDYSYKLIGNLYVGSSVTVPMEFNNLDGYIIGLKISLTF